MLPPEPGSGLLWPAAELAGSALADSDLADSELAGSEPPAPDRPDPTQLHPSLWRAHQLGQQHQAVVASGFARLDAQLPGGGWPTQALTELLLPHAGLGELRLLAPALAQVQAQGRHLLWFDPPARPCSWTLAELGLDWQQLFIVRCPAATTPAPGRSSGPRAATRVPGPAPAAGTSDLLWALEQALRSGHVGAVVAWLPPGVRPESLRRLQLAAQGHDGPVFLLRDVQAQARPSVAVLRLLLAPAGADRLQLHILKRRGPPPPLPLQLALAAVLTPEQRARALRGPAAAARAWPRPVRARPSALADTKTTRVRAA